MIAEREEAIRDIKAGIYLSCNTIDTIDIMDVQNLEVVQEAEVDLKAAAKAGAGLILDPRIEGKEVQSTLAAEVLTVLEAEAKASIKEVLLLENLPEKISISNG